MLVARPMRLAHGPNGARPPERQKVRPQQLRVVLIRTEEAFSIGLRC